jgi:hypothetical protein
MKFFQWTLFLTVFTASFAAAPAKKKAPQKTVANKKSLPAASKTAVQSKALPVRRTGAKSRGPARPVASTLRSRQAVPTPERYKEIQEALAARGYLKTDPNGVWDAQSAEALKQFQTDHNFTPTGKLSSASLIGLGLGPKTSTAPVVPPLPDKNPGTAPGETPRIDPALQQP